MNAFLFYARFIIISLSFIVHSPLIFGQKLLKSRQSSEHTFIYKITNKEAKSIYKSETWQIDSSFFHTLITSYPTDSTFNKKLKEGHYIRTYTEKNKQKISITSIQNFEVFILNNDTDLCIQVYDLKGNLLPNTEVYIGRKKLSYDPIKQIYIHKKSNKKGLLEVSYKGVSAYYNLQRNYNNSFIKRGSRKLLHSIPIKYIWLPVRYTVHLPIDAVKSISKGWAQGTIYHTKKFFVKLYHKIACVFDDHHCEYYTANKFNRKHTGYMVFNKPKYFPKDTVKFKAFLTTPKGRLIDKEVNIQLQTPKRNINLGKLKPYRKGGYKYEFYLHDSLDLELDRNYYIYLTLDNEKKYISNSFYYEDYELGENKLEIRTPTKKHYRNRKLKFFARATDENDLNLMDAKLEVVVIPKKINKYFNKAIFIPDTLSFFTQKLHPSNETEIQIPDSLFPKANFDYSIYFKMITSDNQNIKKNKRIKYFYDTHNFDMTIVKDSLLFDYKENGIKKEQQVRIYGQDNFHNQTLVYKGNTPHKVSLNPYYASYLIMSSNLSDSIQIANTSPLLQCYSRRTPDSLFIQIDNPRKLSFNYTVYKTNKEKEAAYTDSLNLKKKISSKENYFVVLNYLWGGKMLKQNYHIPFIDKKLNLKVSQPKIVYPGQKSKIEITVNDVKGNPVPGVDITAYGLTKKFNYTPPRVPYLGKKQKAKKVINNFHLKNTKLNKNTTLDLDFPLWKNLAKLDSIEFYKFAYPRDTIYTFDYTTTEKITQFSPFIMSNGASTPIHVIYVDNQPVYFSWSNNQRPYSFVISPGSHQIKLRTANKEITIQNLYFKEGKKHIFSLDPDKVFGNVRVTSLPSSLTEIEKKHLYSYIFPYRDNFKHQLAYLEKDNEITLLSSSKTVPYQYTLAGPISGKQKFQLIDSFSTFFLPEPFFEYQFSDEMLRIKEVNIKKYPTQLHQYTPHQNFHDRIFTPSKLKQLWKEQLNSKRKQTARYKYPLSTSSNKGRLLIELMKTTDSLISFPLNILIFKYDNHNFLRVYPGNTTIFHDLEKGNYKLLFFHKNAHYHIVDSIAIQANGSNYYKIEQPPKLRKDAFSVEVNDLIQKTIYTPLPLHEEEEKELRNIYNSYQNHFQYSTEGERIEGYVYDEYGLGLPGVIIYVKGTSYSTTTNIDGYYTLKIPSKHNILQFSSIGFHTEEKKAYNTPMGLILKENNQILDEVVVTGYGVKSKTKITGSINSSETGILSNSGNLPNSLQGKVSGLTVRQRTAGHPITTITIRGKGSITFDNHPLCIINGNIYTGDISQLSPNLIDNAEILKGASAIALYGAQAANGVLIIKTKDRAFQLGLSSKAKGAEYDKSFLEAVSKSSSMRNNFSDYAFWQPSLQTDAEGKASFEVTFPDDVTSWNTYYLAMNDKRQSGQTEDIIKSYKPLLAKLSLPRFILASDTVNIIGKSLNYSPEPIKITTKFEVNDKQQAHPKRYCKNALIDTLALIGKEQDSITIKYFLEKEDGFFDGEQRTLPVFRKGLEKTEGSFYALNTDTTFNLEIQPKSNAIYLYARSNVLEVLKDEIKYLANYKYNCNEQLASRLKGLLAAQNIADYEKKKFRNKTNVKKIISLLLKNKNKDGLWGWWKASKEREWISLHVLEALAWAKMMSYKVPYNTHEILEKLKWKLEYGKNTDSALKILSILNLMNAEIDYKNQLSKIEQIDSLTLYQKLQIIQLKQQQKIKYSLDYLQKFKKETFLGTIFYSDGETAKRLIDNDLQNTLLVYQVLKKDTGKDHAITLQKIRNYLIGERKKGFWANTYESAKIIETILPDLLTQSTKIRRPMLTLKSDTTLTITKFPFKMKVNTRKNITVIKTGNTPIYFTKYEKYWEENPKQKSSDFKIQTRFENMDSILQAGKKVKLLVEVDLKKAANYVLINVPIPGGCSYDNKEIYYYKNEVHREYFRQETAIFCEHLEVGKHTFTIDLIPRFTGRYTLNPAKIEEMYFPIFNANTKTKEIQIR